MTRWQQQRLIALALRCDVRVQIADVAPPGSRDVPKDGYGLRVRYDGCWRYSLHHRQVVYDLREAIYHGEGHAPTGRDWPCNLVHSD